MASGLSFEGTGFGIQDRGFKIGIQDSDGTLQDQGSGCRVKGSDFMVWFLG